MSVRIYVGNALDVLPTALEPNSVNCSVTSPPYYGLRKYAGDQVCDWPAVEYSPMPGLPPVRVEAMTCALGHEPTIEAYVGHLVAIYREVRRILRDDGVAWIVMGDSYSSVASNQQGRGGSRTSTVTGGHGFGDPDIGRKDNRQSNLQQGDLMLVPHRLALALQADGWLIRNDNPWAKVAPMPESVSGWRWERHRVKVASAPRGQGAYVRASGQSSNDHPQRQGSGGMDKAPPTKWQDCPGCPKCEPNDGYILKRGSWRHTRSHEFVFMISKKMGYWSNQEAVREELSLPDAANGTRVFGGNSKHGANANHGHRTEGRTYDNAPSGRNPRSVLSPSPEPFPGPHFAVFPTGLVEPLIKATCPTRCCPVCGAGWSPVVKRKSAPPEVLAKRNAPTDELVYSGTRVDGQMYGMGQKLQNWRNANPPSILGYRPSCDCGMAAYDAVPGVVLDLFFGSGTVGLVCDRLGLDCIGVDISGEYAVDIARERIVAEAPLLARVEVEAA